MMKRKDGGEYGGVFVMCQLFSLFRGGISMEMAFISLFFAARVFCCA